MKPIYIIIFIAVCIIGCKEKKEKQKTDSSIQLLEFTKFIQNDTVSDFDLIDKFKYIKLETNDNCLVGEIAHLKVFDNRIVIADKNERVLVFDTLGQFISQVGALGRGPREYQSLYGMFLDVDKKNIILLDFNKTLYYDLNGKFIKSQNIDSGISRDIVDIDVFKGTVLKQTLCYFNSIYNSTLYTEANFSKPMHFHQYSMNRIASSNQSWNSISKTKDGLTFVKYLSDSIFQFNGTEIYPKYIWDSGKPPIPPKKCVSFNSQNDKYASIYDFFETLEGKYSLGINSIYETKNHMIIFPMSSNTCLWNKHEKKGLTLGKNISLGIKGKINMCLTSTIKDVNDNYIVSAYDYSARKQVLERTEKIGTLIEPELKKFIKECDDYDNPIIALYTLKKEFPWESYKR